MASRAAPLEPALRILALLRGLLKVTLNLDFGYRTAGSAFLRRARLRSRTQFPSGDGRWCARVGHVRNEACVRAWTAVVHRTQRTGAPVACRCHAGLDQFSLPIRRRGRMVGMVLALQAPRPASQGGFQEAYARVRHLPGTRAEWKADFDRLPSLSPERMRSVLEFARDLTEAVLELAALPGESPSILPPDVLDRAGAMTMAVHAAAAASGAAAPHGGGVDRAIAWIASNPGWRGGRTALARTVGCTPTVLARGFKRRTGRSLPAYLNHVRLERARTLLAASAHGIAEIAAQTGFGTRRQFLNVFRSATGRSPRAWRREHWEAVRDAR